MRGKHMSLGAASDGEAAGLRIIFTTPLVDDASRPRRVGEETLKRLSADFFGGKS
jgi:hypothetical protein